MAMKLFRKKQGTESLKIDGSTSTSLTITSKTSSPADKMLVPSNQRQQYIGTDPNKGVSQRRFVQKLYELSEVHGAVVRKSSESTHCETDVHPNNYHVPILLTSATSDTSQNSSPEFCPQSSPSISPHSSPAKVEDNRNVMEGNQIVFDIPTPSHSITPIETRISDNRARVESVQGSAHLDTPMALNLSFDPGCLRSVIQQIAACTDDFFLEKHVSSSSRPSPRKPRVTALGNESSCRGPFVEIPSVITFGPSRGAVAATAGTTSGECRYVFEDELDGIIGSFEGQSNNSVAYKISDRESSSLIDNVWIVSSFAEEDEPALMRPISTVSVTSSISSRSGCMI